MSLKIVESMEAVNDVIDAADYIAQQAGLDTSDRFLQSVKNAYARLPKCPALVRFGIMGSLRSKECAGGTSPSFRNT